MQKTTTTPGTIKDFLTQSIRTNSKLILLVLLCMLVVGVAILLIGLIPEHREVVSLVIFNLPAKITVGLIPIILILKSKTYSEWNTANPNIALSKKDFTNASYLEVFLSSFLGILPLVLIWIAAYLVSLQWLT